MKTIYKYPLVITDNQILFIPAHSKFIHVDNQNGAPCLWAEVNTDNRLMKIHIAIFGTGNKMDFQGKSAQHLGSVICGQFVWHIYELI